MSVVERKPAGADGAQPQGLVPEPPRRGLQASTVPNNVLLRRLLKKAQMQGGARRAE